MNPIYLHQTQTLYLLFNSTPSSQMYKSLISPHLWSVKWLYIIMARAWHCNDLVNNIRMCFPAWHWQKWCIAIWKYNSNNLIISKHNFSVIMKKLIFCLFKLLKDEILLLCLVQGFVFFLKIFMYSSSSRVRYCQTITTVTIKVKNLALSNVSNKKLRTLFTPYWVYGASTHIL